MDMNNFFQSIYCDTKLLQNRSLLKCSKSFWNIDLVSSVDVIHGLYDEIMDLKCDYIVG